MANPLIRKATRSDIEKLVGLRLLLQQHCEESNSLIWRLTDEGKALLRQKVENGLADRNSHILVAELNGEIVGSAHGEVIHRTDYWPKTVGSISTVYVVGKFRRKGVGALLVKKLCEFFDAEGVEDVTLRYIVGNKEAEGLWKKLGFRQVITTAALGLEELISRTSRI
jgi:ribosomal protein S18 acetylase RimI-like enzyme